MPVNPDAVASDAAGGAAFGPWGALAGAGLGLLGSLFGGGPQTQTVTNTGDPALGKYLELVRSLGLGAYNSLQGPNMDPRFNASMGALGRMGGMGTDAMAALLGIDPSGQARAMNPYMSAMNPVFDRLRQAAITNAKLNTTSAFGVGAREGLAQATALRDVGDQQAQFNYQGFSDTMSRLLNAANLGFGANNSLMQGSQWATMLPMTWQQMRMGLLSPGLMSNGANTQTNQIPNQTNPFEAALGGAIAGSQVTSNLGMGRTNPNTSSAGTYGTGWGH